MKIVFFVKKELQLSERNVCQAVAFLCQPKINFQSTHGVIVEVNFLFLGHGVLALELWYAPKAWTLIRKHRRHANLHSLSLLSVFQGGTFYNFPLKRSLKHTNLLQTIPPLTESEFLDFFSIFFSVFQFDETFDGASEHENLIFEFFSSAVRAKNLGKFGKISDGLKHNLFGQLRLKMMSSSKVYV